MRVTNRIVRAVRALAVPAGLTGLLLLSMILGVGDARADSCYRMEPTLSPSWILGGAWTQNGALMLLEPSTHRVLHYDTTVPGLTTLPGRMEEALANLQARSMSRLGDGYVFQLPEKIFLTLDSRFRKQGMVRLTGPGGFDNVAPFQWAPVDGDLLMCGDVDPPGEEGYVTGIFQLSLSDPVGSFVLLREAAKLDPMAIYCRLGLNLMAGVGDVPVVLYFGDGVQLLAFPQGEEVELDVIPPKFRQAPRLPPNPTRAQFPDLIQEIEGADMPYGIFSEGENLYLLLRSPAVGGAQWDLVRLSMEEGGLSYRGTARLPSRARHLAVVAGSERVAFLEKGEIQKIGEQKTEDILFIPTEQLSGITDEGQLLCK